ncbi:hypothetical protein HX870_31810 [Pseudomonas gingeri]|uniref:hypothetical protein n=1 Tax=Pseudomonas gingeri TaxID=117681 RepID=UPI00159F883C|nr:hypothetical protein [Pseudomonas gingeri]NWA29346.1 hypothetical protein [Pseudomonas gingeri]NWD72204.1 hypothetical protein [Pseudomonas gingeri]NWD77848.1 hypothetical protein [Pseudomonas gingeri]
MTTTPSNRPQLVYLVFGKETYHQEAVFSIASALARLRETPDAELDIQVFSDNPEPYRLLPVRVRTLDEATRKSWSGPYGYHFRIKHMAMLRVLEETEQAILIDTDTFFHCSPMELFKRVTPGTLLCNEFYCAYGTDKKMTLYTALSARLNEQGLADDQMMTLNSGVIGLNRQDIGIMERSIQLMDELFPFAQGAYTLEEFCLSLAAYRTCNISECPDLIHHYWGRKMLFRAKIKAWLCKHGAAPLSREALDDACRVNGRLPRPPRGQRMRNKFMTLTLPKQQRQFFRELLYGCYEHANEFDQACGTAWWERARESLEKRLKQPLTNEQLTRWFDSVTVRLLLGKRRESIRHHLLKVRPPV